MLRHFTPGDRRRQPPDPSPNDPPDAAAHRDPPSRHADAPRPAAAATFRADHGADVVKLEPQAATSTATGPPCGLLSVGAWGPSHSTPTIPPAGTFCSSRPRLRSDPGEHTSRRLAEKRGLTPEALRAPISSCRAGRATGYQFLISEDGLMAGAGESPIADNDIGVEPPGAPAFTKSRIVFVACLGAGTSTPVAQKEADD